MLDKIYLRGNQMKINKLQKQTRNKSKAGVAVVMSGKIRYSKQQADILKSQKGAVTVTVSAAHFTG